MAFLKDLTEFIKSLNLKGDGGEQINAENIKGLSPEEEKIFNKPTKKPPNT